MAPVSPPPHDFDPYDRDVIAPNRLVCTEAEFLRLTSGDVGVEWVDGRTSYLPSCTDKHQAVLGSLMTSLRGYSRSGGRNGRVMFLGFGVRTPRGLRSPDLLYLLEASDPRSAGLPTECYWDGADLLVEIVGPYDPDLDLVEKRADYAAAGVPGYWIVDPRPNVRTITVLTLDGGAYRGEPVGDGETVKSPLLPEFAVDVTACLDAR